MFLKLYDSHSINMDYIICILPYNSRADREFLKKVNNGDLKGIVLNWSHGRKIKSVIVTYVTNQYILYTTNITADTIQKRIDEHQKVVRRHSGSDFTKSDAEG